MEIKDEYRGRGEVKLEHRDEVKKVEERRRPDFGAMHAPEGEERPAYITQAIEENRRKKEDSARYT